MLQKLHRIKRVTFISSLRTGNLTLAGIKQICILIDVRTPRQTKTKRFEIYKPKIKLCSQIYSVLNVKVHPKYISIKSRESVIAQLTLSTPIRLKPACRTLKFWMYSCSNFAWNFTFLSATEPGKSMSMNWQYAAPAKRKKHKSQDELSQLSSLTFMSFFPVRSANWPDSLLSHTSPLKATKARKQEPSVSFLVQHGHK